MKIYKTLLVVIAASLINCDNSKEKLFWISEPDGERNDLLFMAESTNLPNLSGDSLKLFLSYDELKGLDTSTMRYKNFGHIYTAKKFKVFVLLKSTDSFGRDYVFLARSYDHQWNVIDSYELAIWNEVTKKYCFGSINRNLIIERKCGEGGHSDIRQVTDDGKIIMTSYYEP